MGGLTQPDARAKHLYDSTTFENLHQSVASLGDTAPPDALGGDKLGQHFVAFVKGDDGHLYELEGSRVCLVVSLPTIFLPLF